MSLYPNMRSSEPVPDLVPEPEAEEPKLPSAPVIPIDSHTDAANDRPEDEEPLGDFTHGDVS